MRGVDQSSADVMEISKRRITMFSSGRNREHRFAVLSLLLCLAVVLSALAVASKGCLAADAPPESNLVFILDASGSMAAKVQNKVKMDIAKEVLSGLIKDLPAGINVGLVAYGHRQKADCNDVEELAPLSPFNKDELINKIKALNPKGKTPITISVRQVADNLATTEDGTTIILVSDGEETCGGDPCALVKELKESGVKFVMHVIGFDVGEKEKAQLSCIAQAGGGSYFAAKNAGELSLAARKTVEKAEQSAATFKVKALRNGKPLKAYATVLKAVEGEEEENEREKVAEGWIEPEGTAFKLAPGVYDLQVQNEEDADRPSLSFAAVKIESGKSIEKVADFSGGTLRVKALRNGKPFNAYAVVLKAVEGEDEEKEREKVTEGWTEPEGTAFNLTPGVYDLQVQNEEDADRPTVSFTAVKIESGKSIEKVADFSGGTLRVKASRNGKPFSAYAVVLKAGEGEDDEKEREKVAEGWTDPEGTAFKLTPGVYDVEVQNEEDAGKLKVDFKAVTVEAGKSVEKVAEFSGGTLRVKALRNGKPSRAYCTILKAEEGEDEEKEQEKVAEGWIEPEGAAFKLAPGVYDVQVLNEEDVNRPTVSFTAVAVEAAKSVEKVAEFSGGTLKVKVTRSGKPFKAYCFVFKASESEEVEQAQVADGWVEPDGTSFKLTPGVYDVRVEDSDTGDEKLIEAAAVEAGKVQTVEAQF
jgi:Ca-activated chloride channel family protein